MPRVRGKAKVMNLNGFISQLGSFGHFLATDETPIRKFRFMKRTDVRWRGRTNGFISD